MVNLLKRIIQPKTRQRTHQGGGNCQQQQQQEENNTSYYMDKSTTTQKTSSSSAADKLSILELTPDWINDIATASLRSSDASSAALVLVTMGREQQLPPVQTQQNYHNRLLRNVHSQLDFPTFPEESNSPVNFSGELNYAMQQQNSVLQNARFSTFIQRMDSLFDNLVMVETDNDRDSDELTSSSSSGNIDTLQTDEMVNDDDAAEEEDIEDTITPLMDTSPDTNFGVLFTDHYERIFQLQTLTEKLFYACSMPKDTGLRTLEQLLRSNGRGKKQDIDIFRDPLKNDCGLLHTAAQHNNVECMQYLITYHGADVNMVDAINSTPLHHACSNDARDSVVFLLSNGASINAKDSYECSPLLVSLRNNHLELIKILKLFNTDIHSKSKNGDTCLHIAAREGYLKRVKFLVEQCDASVSRLNANNEHVLFAALSHSSIAQLICDRIDSYKSFTRLISVMNVSGRTVIHEACDHGHLESLLVIIQAFKKKAIADKCMHRLHGFLVNILNEAETATGYTPLHLAVQSEHERIAKYLALSCEVEVDKKDVNNGNTALHMAVELKNSHICDILIRMGKANIQAKNSKRVTCKKLGEKIGMVISCHDETKRHFSLSTLKRSTKVLFRSHHSGS